MRAAIIGLVSLVEAAASIHAYGDVVERRGTEPGLEGQVTKINDAGVTLNSESGATHFVPWDRVRTVSMERPDPAIEQYQDDALNLWRARTRLERNDAALAEPLFERLFETYRGKTHETALVVAEGLLRCRLSRNAFDSAVLCALETSRLRRASVTTASYSMLLPVIDDRTALCSALAPVWVVSSTLIKLERELGNYDAQGDTVIAAQAALYRRAIRHLLGMDSQEHERVLTADHPGIVFLQSIVELDSHNTQVRNSAREALMRDLADRPLWMQAWSHYFVGASMLSESGLGRQQTGLVNLAHLPARFAADQPYLAGHALAHLVEACNAAGQAQAASSLLSELDLRYPNHPARAAVNRTVPATTQPVMDDSNVRGFTTLNKETT